MTMHERWLDERHHEYYYKLAKKMNYRSRASFKIMQIDDRFGIFREGDRVVDLGAAPGGWLQVAKERVGEKGFVIGVDLRPIKPLPGITTITGDITDDATMKRLLELVNGQANVILSDMAPNIGGHYSTDHARSINLCMYAVDVCDRILKKGVTTARSATGLACRHVLANVLPHGHAKGVLVKKRNKPTKILTFQTSKLDIVRTHAI